jgi:hypothetical protein
MEGRIRAAGVVRPACIAKPASRAPQRGPRPHTACCAGPATLSVRARREADACPLYAAFGLFTVSMRSRALPRSRFAV